VRRSQTVKSFDLRAVLILSSSVKSGAFRETGNNNTIRLSAREIIKDKDLTL